MAKPEIDYKFDEPKYIKEFVGWINQTYEPTYHYGASKIQAAEVIIDAGHGTGFCVGNVIKYSKRYGLKEGYNRKELLKIIHYALIQLYVHDKEGLGDEPNVKTETVPASTLPDTGQTAV